MAYFVVSRFSEFENRTNAAFNSIATKSKQTLTSQSQRLMRSAGYLRSFSAKALQKDQMVLSGTINQLQSNTLRFLEKQKRELEHFQAKINLLHPEEILKRGFSITLLNGKNIKSQNQVNPGDLITTILMEGSIESIIQPKTKKNER